MRWESKRLTGWLFFSSFLGTFLAAIDLAAVSMPSGNMGPNVIVILVDDLGWGDLVCYGNEKFQTPHLCRMAREGPLEANSAPRPFFACGILAVGITPLRT